MPTRSPHRVRNATVALGAIVVLGWVGALKPITRPLAAGITAVAAPLYATAGNVSAGFGRLFGTDAGEQQEREDLARQIEALRLENASLRELAAENAALKASLGYREHDNLQPLTAAVISETPGDIFHGLVIDRGSEDGVRPDQPVIAGDGVIIGKIFSTRPHTASVLLLSDSRSRLAVTVQQADGTAGVLEGDRGLSMTINLIPQTVTLSPGDTVVTSGIEPGIRRGLAVGTVEKVVQHTQDPFQSAMVVPFSAANHPPFVQVLVGDAAHEETSIIGQTP